MKKLLFALLLLASCEKNEICRGKYIYSIDFINNAEYQVQGDSIYTIAGVYHDIYVNGRVMKRVGLLTKVENCGF